MKKRPEHGVAINASNDMAASTPFITFMLSAIRSSITETIKMIDEMSDEMIDEHLYGAQRR